jgi:hypothetical protein
MVDRIIGVIKEEKTNDCDDDNARCVLKETGSRE